MICSGLDDVLIACVDGLKGFPDAIAAEYPQTIRNVNYTTNAIESLNSVIRKATKRWKLCADDDSALKVVFLADQHAVKRWTMPIRDWKPAMNRFIIEFDDHLDGHL